MNRIYILCLISVLSCFCVTGCGPNAQKMVTDQTSFGVRHQATVALNAKGGSPGAAWYSAGTIPLETYRDAVKMSLEKSNLFEEIVDEKIADYILNVNLSWAVAASHGFYFQAVVNAKWDLVKGTSGENVWSAELIGNKGASKANISLEKAAKKNIEDGLDQISKLTLTDVEQ